MAQLAIVTTCRGRLAHLQQSLPPMARQPGTQCVLVDYGCPEGSGDWAERNFPHVKVVRAPGAARFEISRARNLGAAAASAPWLCFADADGILAPGFAQQVQPLLQRRHYLRPEPRSGDGAGMCICAREDFDRVGGYDDVMQGWGMEDRDLYQRLEMAGVARAAFPGSLVAMIAHSTDERVQHYEIKVPELNSAVNLVYCTAKWDTMRLRGMALAREQRRALYEKVRGAVLSAHEGGTELNLQIGLASRKTISGAVLESRLHYHMGRTVDEAGQPLRQQAGHLRDGAQR